MMIDLTVPEHDLKQARCEPGEAEDLQNLDGAEERFAAARAEVEKLNVPFSCLAVAILAD